MTLADLTNIQYLGDGVYVGFNFGALWLITSDGIKITNEICLEPEVIQAFKSYLEGLEKQ